MSDVTFDEGYDGPLPGESWDDGGAGYRDERAFRSFAERFGPNFPAAYEDASAMSEELRDLAESEEVVRAAFERRKQVLAEALARGREFLVEIEADLAGLTADEARALKPITTSQEWRKARLMEFQQAYNQQLRIKRNQHSMTLPGGTLAWTVHSPKSTFAEKIGPDGNPLPKTTDEEAFVEVLAVLKRVGLHEQHAALVDMRPKVALAEAKRCLKVAGESAVLEVRIRGSQNPKLEDAVIAEGGECKPDVDRSTGEVLGYTVTLPAVQIIRDKDGETVLRQRPLVRLSEPEPPTVKFRPAKPGVPTDETEQEDETDGD